MFFHTFSDMYSDAKIMIFSYIFLFTIVFSFIAGYRVASKNSEKQ